MQLRFPLLVMPFKEVLPSVYGETTVLERVCYHKALVRMAAAVT